MIFQSEYAKNGITGQPIHIKDAMVGKTIGDYVCPNPECHQPMIAAKGKIRRHYFRHHKGSFKNVNTCNELLLHYNAKHILAERIKQQLQISIEYPCGCGDTHTMDLPTFHHAEVEITANWQDMLRRPDVTAYLHNEYNRLFPATYFEIVVSHLPEYDIYDHRIDAPILIIHVYGEEEIDFIRSGTIKVMECVNGPCQYKNIGPHIPIKLYLSQRQWQLKLLRSKRLLNEMQQLLNEMQQLEKQKEKDMPIKQKAWDHLSRMRQHKKPMAQLKEWKAESFKRDGRVIERYLRRNTLLDLYARADILLKVGFEQHYSKSGLFMYKTPEATLYADLRSTDGIDIWDAPEPALYPSSRYKDENTEKYKTALVQYAHHILNLDINRRCSARVHLYNTHKLNTEIPLTPWNSELYGYDEYIFNDDIEIFGT